jgi:hypothetical protein
MLLTPQWKRAIIPRVTEQLFTWFNLDNYNALLHAIIIRCSNQHNEPFNCIDYRNHYYSPYTLKGVTINACRITKQSPHYPAFNALLEQQELYSKLTKEAVNWISCGLAMCHTVDCVCEVFPEFILDKFEYAAAQPNLKFNKIHTGNPKFLRFIQNNEHIEREIKTNLVIQMLSPGEMYGKDSIQ